MITAEADPPRDELLVGAARPGSAWRALLAAVHGLGKACVRERMHQLDRLLAEEGAAALHPPWRCDAVPFLIDQAEFATLEAGLAQRARLLEAFLADAYGGGTAITAGLLPPALVFASPHHLHPCRAAGFRRHLLFYAADLARQPDGGWCVLADHTAGPSGIAQAILNRRLLARLLPELFHALDVAPIRPFFEQALATASPAGNPRWALLSPGRQDPRWFEHLLLAQELGCTLVQPADLTLRQGHLSLKTLRGLQRIDGLLSMVPGRVIDPLELPAESEAGVAGLFAAMRAGHVTVLNSPGAALAEAPALAAFLPQLARHFLAEELALPSIETLWLGDPDARARVAASPADYIGRAAADPAAGSPNARQKVTRPWSCAATLVPTPCFTPALSADGNLESLPVLLRLFLAWDGAAWRALPGGLARAAAIPQAGLAKDVWILRSMPSRTDERSHLAVPGLPVRRQAGDLPSRVADDFFWFGRYLERLEHAARLGAALLTRLARASMLPQDRREILALTACLADLSILAPTDADLELADRLASALAQVDGTVAALTRKIDSLADALRDRLSGEMHAAIVHGVYSLVDGCRTLLTRRQTAPAAAAAARLLSQIIEFCAAVAGFAAENMVRGGGRLFLDIGRRIERAQNLSAALARVLAAAAGTESALVLALELCDSTITYRARYPGLPQPALTLDLVFADEDNPRSLLFQLSESATLLRVLDPADAAHLAALLEEPRAALRRAAAGPASAVPDVLRTTRAAATELSDAITRRYFSHAVPTSTGMQR